MNRRPGTRSRRAATAAKPPAPPRAAAVAAPPVADRAVLAAWLVLVALVIARLVLASLPGTWAWSLALQRFLAPATSWLTWTAMLLALVPPLAARALPVLEVFGDAFARGAWGATAALAALLAVFVLRFPDQVQFVGDFLIRQGSVTVQYDAALISPQAMPLDLALHYRFPAWLQANHGITADISGRLIGMAYAALLAVFAARLSRAMGLAGAAAAAAAFTVAFGGYLGMFTGYLKAFAPLTVLAVAAAGSAAALVRTGRGAIGLGLAIGLAIAFHRSALGLLPGAVVAFALATRAHGAALWRKPATAIGALLAIGSLGGHLPRMIEASRRFDSIHFTPYAVQQKGLLAATFEMPRPLDVVNLLVLLSPAWLPALAAVLAGGLRPRAGEKPPESWPGAAVGVTLLALALPLVLVMPFIHPAQGLFRDWDDFAATGSAFACVVAFAIGRLVAARRAHAWLAVPLVLAVAMAAAQWLAIHEDLHRGLRRVHAFLEEAPIRTETERGLGNDYLGARHFRLAALAEQLGHAEIAKQQFLLSARAFGNAAITSPSPRILHQWGLAAARGGDYPTAKRGYEAMLAKDSTSAMGWISYSNVTFLLGDWANSRRAAHKVLELVPGNGEALQLLRDIEAEEAKAGAGPGR